MHIADYINELRGQVRRLFFQPQAFPRQTPHFLGIVHISLRRKNLMAFQQTNQDALTIGPIVAHFKLPALHPLCAAYPSELYLQSYCMQYCHRSPPSL